MVFELPYLTGLEACRTMLWRNLCFSLRMLRKNPGFTLVTVLTLGLGIGANTSIFSVVNAALLRPLPYRQPDRLVVLAETRQQLASSNAFEASYPDFSDWKRTARSFQSIAGFAGDAFTLAAGDEPRNIFAAQATASFFSTLGVQPSLGRDFVEADRQADFPAVTILSDGLWRSAFGADPNILNRVIRLDGKPVMVIGVLPRSFQFAPAGSAQLWVPLHPGPDGLNRRSLRWLRVVARLGDGVTADQARAEMVGITSQLARAYPKEDGSISIVMDSLRERIVGKIRPLLLVLLGAVGFVLLITCANIASLLMTRSIGRRKEFAMRAALGASRGGLLAQWLTESLLLSFLGAAAGLIFANWGVYLLIAAIPEQQLRSFPFLREAGINFPVLAFLFGVTLLTGIFFGLAPGLAASELSLNDALKDESRGGTSAVHARLRNGLVIAEIATSMVLLAGAGLMVRSLRALIHQDPGYDPSHVLTFSVNLPDASYPSERTYPFNSPSAIRFEHAFTERLRNLPGVLAVAAANGIPANGGSGSIRFLIQGQPKATGQEDEANILTVNTAYFSTLKIPLVTGRWFTAGDSVESVPVLIVNRAFVRAYFPNQDPLGQRVRFTFNAKEPFRQIVGVVGDAAEIDLATTPPPVVYYPNDQGPTTFLSYMLRTAGDPAAFAGAARAALYQMDPQLPVIQPATLEQVAQQSPAVFLRRYPSYLIASFAALALILATIGLYGLVAHTVVERTREIGIRVTLGAQRRDILRLILRQGFSAALAGVGIGVVAGLALTRLLNDLLFGIKAGDWSTFAGVAALLLLVAAVASLVPARRATAIDPMAALRHQ
jgi:predicted permease